MKRSVSTVLGSIGLLLVAGGNLPPLACAGPSGEKSGTRQEGRQQEPPEPARLKAALDRLREAPAGERRRATLDLIDLGPGALGEVRQARNAAGDAGVRDALEYASRWLVAARLKPVLAERAGTGLSFDGQFADLKEGDPEAAAALVELLDDEETDPRIRIAAAHALADVGDPSILPLLRRIEDDPLLSALIREEAGILMAILGDTTRVDTKVRDLLAKLEKKSLGALERKEVNVDLSNFYYRIRDYQKAIECYDRAIPILEAMRNARRSPNPELQKRISQELARELAQLYYNAACSLSLAKEIERAKTMIRKAVELDLNHLKNIEKDGDLRNLRDSPGYEKFKAELEKPLEKKSI